MHFNLHRLSPRSYGIIYLTLIPLFALIYWSLEDHFYQSTASVEVAGRQVTKQAEVELTNAVKSFFGDAKLEKIGFPITEPIVAGLDTSAQVISFRTPFQVLIPKSFSRSRHQLIWQIMVPPVPPHFPSEGSSDNMVELAIRIESVPRFMTLALASEKARPSTDVTIGPMRGHIYPATDGGGPDGWIDGFVKLPKKSYEAIERFHASRSGSLASVEGGFGRALYLSVVTIATLGYGDIVPVTSWARFWVGLETLIGVVIIGFFINSASVLPKSIKSGD